MITIKKAEKISAIYKKVEVLHKELIKLNKIANTILQTEGSCDINLSTDKVKESKKEDILDEDGSLKNSSDILSYTFRVATCWGTPELKEDYSSKESVKLEIDDILTLEVLGVLISRKQTEIDKYLKEINKL